MEPWPLQRRPSQPLCSLPLPFFLAACCLSTAGEKDAGGAHCSASAKAPAFGSPGLFTQNKPFSADLAVGDFNGDGVPDVVQANFDESNMPGFATTYLGIYLGLQDGGLSAPRLLAGSFESAMPFDPDSGVPLAVLRRPPAPGGRNQIDLCKITGDAIASTTPLGTARNPFAVADLDGDGRPDLAVCEDAKIVGFYGPNLAFFQDLAPQGCAAIAAGDLNQDGIPDLVAISATVTGTSVEEDILVMVAERDGGYTLTTYPTASTKVGFGIALQDVNGDGLPDIAAAGGMGFSILLNQGAGRFAGAVAYSAEVTTYNLAVADFNGDCWPDVLTSQGEVTCPSSSNSPIYLFLNHGDGAFLDPIPIATGLPGPWSLVAYKGTGASLSSIAVADVCSGTFEILPNTTKP